eukprot:6422036-Amphidinium_carterae.1
MGLYWWSEVFSLYLKIIVPTVCCPGSGRLQRKCVLTGVNFIISLVFPWHQRGDNTKRRRPYPGALKFGT